MKVDKAPRCNLVLKQLNYQNSVLRISKIMFVLGSYEPLERLHTAGLDTIFIQIYMDPPPGVPGVSKNQIFFQK